MINAVTQAAYRQRDAAIRLAISDDRLEVENPSCTGGDLDSGRWHEQHQDLLGLDQWDAGFRLIVSHA